MEDLALKIGLQCAVPLHIARVRELSDADRARLAMHAGEVIAHQGDNLMYGSSRKYGHGAKQESRHKDQCADPKCWCKGKGQPDYSPGELFNLLAEGIACAAYAPGGITFLGLHWEATEETQ